MTIKDKTIQELDSLGNKELQVVYKTIKILKRKPKSRKYSGQEYLQVRDALKKIGGSLSSDIIDKRSDRI